MKQYPASRIHNIGIIGAGSTGKSLLTQALLVKAGVAARLTETSPSTNATFFSFEWQDHKINLIDTPGYIDFIGEAISTMRVVDSLIIVVDAVSGHGAALETLWKIADTYNLPRMIVVNKLDKSQANFENVLTKLREKFSCEVVPVQAPDGQEANFKGAKSLLSTNVATEDTKFKEMLIEGVAEIDDTILTEYLEGQAITEEELTQHVIKALDQDKIFPVFCASAAKGLGIEEILNAAISWMPKADEKQALAKDSAGSELKIAPDATAPFSAYVFKVVSEPHIGNLTYVRVYSGAVSPASMVFNSSQGKDERIGQIMSLSSLSAGDIAVLPKLKVTTVCDTLCDKNRQIIFEPAKYPHPAMSFAVKPKSKADQEKMSQGLGSFAGEDPTFHLSYNSETHETVISGMGDVHLEMMIKKLKERFGVEIEVGEPRIPYKETIKGKTKAQGKYKKQTGGHGQYGDTWIEIEPLPAGEGFQFVNKVVGGAIPKNYIPAVEKGIREAMAQGIVAGYPAVDVKVTLYDGSYHEVDSSDMAFRIAASMGFKKAFSEAQPTLLEPIVEITVNVPPEFVGEVTGDLNKRRGRILTIEADKVVALVPQGEISKYATDLRSFTHGQGVFSTKFSHYEQVPPQTQQKLMAAYQKLKEGGMISHADQ